MKIFGQFYFLSAARKGEIRGLDFVLVSLVFVFAGTLLLPEAHSATLYSEDFDDGNASTRWTTITSGVGTSSNFAFDYSAVTDFNGNLIGVPQAGQTTHTGLKLAANVSGTPGNGAVAGINAYANSLN